MAPENTTNPEDAANEQVRKKINTQLRRARLSRLWPIKKAAKEIGVSETTYIRWEHGEQLPHLVNLQAICNAFGLSPTELGYGDLIAERESEPLSLDQTGNQVRLLDVLMELEAQERSKAEREKNQQEARLQAQLRQNRLDRARLEAQLAQLQSENSRRRTVTETGSSSPEAAQLAQLSLLSTEDWQQLPPRRKIK